MRKHSHRIIFGVATVNGNTETYELRFAVYGERQRTPKAIRGLGRYYRVKLGEGKVRLDTNDYFQALLMKRVAQRFANRHGRLHAMIAADYARWRYTSPWRKAA